MADSNTIEILVKSRDDAKPDLEALKARLEELKNEVATARADVDDADAAARLDALKARLEDLDHKTANPKITMSGAVRAEAQIHAVEAAMRHLDDTAARETAESGAAAGESFAGRFASSLLPGRGGAITMALSSLLGALPAAGGLAGVGIGTALLGGMGAVIAKGAVSQVQPAVTAFENAQSTTGKAAAKFTQQYKAALAALTPVQQQFTQTLINLDGAWQDFINKNTAGVQTILSQGMGLLPKIFTQLTGLFKTIVPTLQPVITAVGNLVQGLIGVMQAAAPAMGPFIRAILGLAQGVLPGLTAIIKATVPYMGQFISLFSKVGSSLGQMLSAMAPAIGPAMQVLSALLGAVSGLLPVIGQLASMFAKALAPVLTSFAGALKALEPAFQTIGKLVASFAGAVLNSLAGALQAIAGLLKSVAPALDQLANAFSQVFTMMENRGVFNDLEDAFEKLVPPLSKFISGLVTGLVPILPSLVGFISQLAGILQGVMIAAVEAILPPLTQIVNALLRFLNQAIIPILPQITQLATQFATLAEKALLPLMPYVGQLVTMLIQFLEQALRPLLPAVLQLADALIKILISVTPIVPPLAQLLVQLTQLAIDVLTPLIPLITNVVRWLTGLANIIEKVVSWVAKIIAAIIKFAAHLADLKKTAEEVGNAIGKAWDDVYSTITRIVTKIAGWLRARWDDMRHDVAHWTDDVVRFFEQLPGRIINALAGLAGMMFRAGVHAIERLIDGITSMFGKVGDVMSSLASKVAGFFGLSPAKEGPLSGGGAPEIRGAHFAEAFAAGVAGGTNGVAAAVRRLADVASLPAAVTVAAGGSLAAQQPVTIKLDLSGRGSSGLEDQFMTWLKEKIRVSGGDPRILTKKVQFA